MNRLLEHLEDSPILPRFLVRRERSRAMAAVLAKAAPSLAFDVVTTIADAGLVLFAIDDLLDDDDISSADVALRVAQWSAVARGERCPEVAFDPIATAIATLRNRLASAAWSASLERMLAAMGEERRAGDEQRATGRTPGLRAYLRNGAESVGTTMIDCTAWAAMGTTTALVSRLLPAARSFSLALRLANDVRSWDRERHAPRLNAVALVDGRVDRLRAMRDRALATGRSLIAGLEHTPPARFLDAFAVAVVSLYETGDFTSRRRTARAAGRWTRRALPASR